MEVVLRQMQKKLKKEVQNQAKLIRKILLYWSEDPTQENLLYLIHFSIMNGLLFLPCLAPLEM